MDDDKDRFNQIFNMFGTLNNRFGLHSSLAALERIEALSAASKLRDTDRLGIISSLQSITDGIHSLSAMDQLRNTVGNSISKSVMESLDARNLYANSIRDLVNERLDVNRLGISSLQSIADGIHSLSAMDQLRNTVGNSITKSVMESLDARNLNANSIRDLVNEGLDVNRLGITSSLQSAKEGIGSFSAMDQFRDTISAIDSSNSISKLFDESSDVRNLFGSKSLDDLVNQVSSINAFQNAVGSMAKPENFANILGSFTFEDISETEIFGFEEESTNEVELQLETIADAEDLNAFVQAFEKLPKWFQMFLFILIIDLIVPTYFRHHLECKLPFESPRVYRRLYFLRG